MNHFATKLVSTTVSAFWIAAMSLQMTSIFEVNAEEPKKPSVDDDQSKNFDNRVNTERLELMRRRVNALKAEVETSRGPEKAELIPSPLLRFNNLASKIIVDDATVWAWSHAGRPVILATAEPDGVEVVSLCESAVSMSGSRGLKWKAPATEMQWKRVPKAPEPAGAATERARQMKEICARFSAFGRYGDGTDQELRLLVRHLHRYGNPDDKLIDGAIFALAGGTNPEVILLLECRETEKDQKAWYYGLARQSGGNLETRLDGNVVWECPAIKGWDTRAPYTNFKFDPD